MHERVVLSVIHTVRISNGGDCGRIIILLVSSVLLLGHITLLLLSVKMFNMFHVAVRRGCTSSLSVIATYF